jgi:hypothetical protein
MRCLVLLSCLLATLLPARAGLKIVTKFTVEGHETVSTQYMQGRNMRSEGSELARVATRRTATIFNFDHRSQYVLDLNAKEYIESLGPDFLSTLAMWIRRSPRARDSGKTVDVYYETVDTGERRQKFGHMARHLVTRERRVAQPGACSGNSEVETDGWYITLSWHATSYEAYLQAVDGYPCRDKTVAHGVKITKGFPVVETVTEKSPGPAGSTAHLWSTTREIVNLSQEPLDRNLFEPPHDFKHVDSLPGDRGMSWTERLDFEWRQLEQSVESWFD